MNILNKEQLRATDQYTIKVQGISSWDLMERAAGELFKAITRDFPHGTFSVLCGPGNNGGDGLALGRMLKEQGINTQVFLLEGPKYSEDNLQNQKSLENFIVFNSEDLPDLWPDSIIIDALYGFGLRAGLGMEWKPLFERLETRLCLSVDLPSGLLADELTTSPYIKADKVYTFHCPKKAFFAPEHGIECFEILDIGLESLGPCQYQYLDNVHLLLHHPSRFAHKGTFGQALLVGGSKGMTGALDLATKAALRGGCGIVKAYGPGCTPDLPSEALVQRDSNIAYIKQIPKIDAKTTAVAVGMGMGPDGQEALFDFLNHLPPIPLVLDADALNILSKHPDKIPAGAILTPHPKELDRIVGSSKSSFERWQKAEDLAKGKGIYLIVKGANTHIFFPDGKILVNSSGNYGMAKGGCGDVLSGLLTAILAQGYPVEKALPLAVYLHGLAGDLAADNLGPDAMNAGDILTFLPEAWRFLRKKAYTASRYQR
jgi:hydroxyethylthiazole kinase-like uncharacterized protein yjeF